MLCTICFARRLINSTCLLQLKPDAMNCEWLRGNSEAVKSEVLTAVKMLMFFWIVMPCGLVGFPTFRRNTLPWKCHFRFFPSVSNSLYIFILSSPSVINSIFSWYSSVLRKCFLQSCVNPQMVFSTPINSSFLLDAKYKRTWATSQ
jgi:hypothetical protein